MKYLLLITGEEPAFAPGDEAFGEMARQYGEYAAWLDGKGWLLGGEALKHSSSAVTVRVRDEGRSVTDGPFAETKEQLGGYYLVDCPTFDDAIEAAARIPGARFGAIEVRAIEEMP
jgi:hypothetical protein